MNINLFVLLIFNMLYKTHQFGTSIIVPYPYPLFKQCDKDGQWKNEIIDSKTLCSGGSLIVSLAMAFSGAGLKIPQISSADVLLTRKNPMNTSHSALPSEPSNPKSLVNWLRNNQGTGGLDNVIESVVPNIEPDRIT